jgi:hypothetical protein
MAQGENKKQISKKELSARSTQNLQVSMDAGLSTERESRLIKYHDTEQENI